MTGAKNLREEFAQMAKEILNDWNTMMVGNQPEHLDRRARWQSGGWWNRRNLGRCRRRSDSRSHRLYQLQLVPDGVELQWCRFRSGYVEPHELDDADSSRCHQ